MKRDAIGNERAKRNRKGNDETTGSDSLSEFSGKNYIFFLFSNFEFLKVQTTATVRLVRVNSGIA